MRPWRLALWLLAAEACATSAPPQTTAPRARRTRRPRRSRAPAARPARTTPDAEALCAPVRAGSDAVVRSLGASALERWPVLGLGAHCVDAGTGAWALRVDRARVEDGALFATWSLVFVTRDGVRGSVRPWSEGEEGPEDNLTCAPEDACTEVDPPSAYDHDGDGVAEVSVVVRSRRPWADDADTATEHGRLWTFRAGAVGLYGPARALVVHAHEDVDRDGRPDVLTYGPYVGEAPGPCGQNPWTLTGPLFALRARPGGTFALGDAAAPGALRCDEPAGGGYLDRVRALSRSVVCARVRGQDTAAMLRAAAARAEFRPRGCRPGGPGDLDVLRAWATAPPWNGR